MVEAEAEGTTLEFTSTWVVAMVCCAIVLISFLVHRFLQCAGQLLSRPSRQGPNASKGRRKHLFDALQKIKEELMLLGFISLLLSVFQTRIGKICMSERLANVWLPCHQPASSSSTTTANFSTNPIVSDGYRGRLLLANTTDYCTQKGKVPLLSLTALHHLHIFIFVLATFHVIVCVVIILCGEAKVYDYGYAIGGTGTNPLLRTENRYTKLTELAKEDDCSFGRGKRYAVISRLHIFSKHFFPSVTKLEYIAIRLNCIKDQDLKNPNDDFQEYIIGGVQKDFDKVVGISWYLWLFVVIFLLLNVAGWNAYFWISFLPLTVSVVTKSRPFCVVAFCRKESVQDHVESYLVETICFFLAFSQLLLVVGAKLEHVVTRKTKMIIETYNSSAGPTAVTLSDEDFWFHKPQLVLDLIHIILFQNSFELAFFFFILFQYDFNSCIMGKVGYVVPRLVIGVCVQLMCSYRTLPLYAIMKSQMSPKRDHPVKEKEMKIVTFIWSCIDKWNSRKAATNNGSTQGGSREGIVANEQTIAIEIE